MIVSLRLLTNFDTVMVLLLSPSKDMALLHQEQWQNNFSFLIFSWINNPETYIEFPLYFFFLLYLCLMGNISHAPVQD